VPVPRRSPGRSGLECDPAGGELLLDPARLLLALVEALAFGCCKLQLRLRATTVVPRARELRLELGLAGGDPSSLRSERGLALLERALPGVECLGPVERGALAGDERIARTRALAALAARLRVAAGVRAPLQIRKLTLPRCHRLGAVAERLLQLLELGARVLALGVPLLGELAGEAQERLPVQVHLDPGIVRRRCLGSRRPAVEPLLPAVYARSFRQQTLTMYGRPASLVRQVSHSISTGPSARSMRSDPVCTDPCCTCSK